MSDLPPRHPDSLRLIDYVRGRLDRDEAVAVHRHLLMCDRCGSEAETLARLRCAVGLEVPFEMRWGLAVGQPAQ